MLPAECYHRDASVPAGPDAATPVSPCVCLDYGVLPDPGKDCCGNPIVQPEPADAGDQCANVCCMCDYGVFPIPPGCCEGD